MRSALLLATATTAFRCTALVLLPLLPISCGASPDAAPIAGAWLAPYGPHSLSGPPLERLLDRVRAAGLRWIALGPEIPMADIHAPALGPLGDDRPLRETIRAARRRGLDVMLLPRIESPAFFAPPYPWRADIAMPTPAAWDTFHAAYRAILLDCAALAEQEDVALLGLGLEYREASLHHPEAWRSLARAVRAVFTGRLTYSANWHGEFEDLSFWDALDLIGIGAYYPPATTPRAPAVTMEIGYRPFRARLEALSRRTNKPILFTEVGFTGYADAGLAPWKWQGHRNVPIDHHHQAACFTALLHTFLPEPWFAGLLVWRCYPTDVPAWEYTPLGRPAESPLRRHLAR